MTFDAAHPPPEARRGGLRRARALAGLVSLGASTVLLATPVEAQTVSAPASSAAEHAAEARRSYGDLDYPGAVAAAEAALTASSATDLDRARALEVLAWTRVVLGQEAAAREAFAQLFALDPYWPIEEPSGAPRIVRLGESVRATRVRDAALDPHTTVRLALPRVARVGRESSVEAHVDGGSPGARVEIVCRGVTEGAWDVLPTTREGARFIAQIPPRTEADDIEVYARVRDAQGRVIASAGGPLAPLVLPVEPVEAASSDALWLGLGLGGGALAVGAAVAVGLLVGGPSDAPAGTLTPGRVELPLGLP